MAYTATKGGLLEIDNTINTTETSISSNQAGALYQWIDCNTNLPIENETNQTFSPSSANGTYRVEVTTASCTELSDCFVFATLGLETFNKDEVTIYPNPSASNITINLASNQLFKAEIKSVSGKIVLSKNSLKKQRNLRYK